MGSWTWLLLSHVLSLSTVAFIDPESDLTEASLFTEPMTVARPMSCMAIEVAIPPLDLLSFTYIENALHSGPVSSILTLTTKPQPLQTSSPPALSTTIGPLPHLGHLSSARCNFISLE